MTLTQDFNNTINAAASMDFDKGEAVSSTCTWEVTSGLKMSETITESIGIPELEKTSFSETMELDFS